MPLLATDGVSAGVEDLARLLAGPDANPRVMLDARAAAETELDLRRVWAVKQQVLERGIAAQEARGADAAGEEVVLSQALITVASDLLRLDRYERRVRSRRRKALRQLKE